MKVFIGAVNFNTNEKVKSFLESIHNNIWVKNLELLVLVVSNGEENYKLSNKYNFNLKLVKTENLGYINSLNYGIEKSKINIHSFDYFAISNVDVKIGKHFFDTLNKLKFSSNIGWISPSIISEKEKLDRNPKILSSPQKKKIQMLLYLYKYPFCYKIYKLVFYKANRRLKIQSKKSKIYAGHGSFMLFTKKMMKKTKSFSYPGFLFGEEIFFGEICYQNGLIVIYEPKLKIYDTDHVSTSKLNNSELMKMNHDSLKLILKTLYRE